jgi:hypothetical protein
MFEGLKNAIPVFCRMMKAILKDHICKNIFTCVDDIAVASKKKITQIEDLAKTFANMCGAQLKLNPKKCVIGVQR